MIPTDRSRIETTHACNRARFWGYEYDGMGLVQDGPPPVDLCYGLAFHEGADHLVAGGTLEEALAIGKAWTDKITTTTTDGHPASEEYYALLYGHLRALSEYFLPRFLGRYEVLCAETEMVMELSPSVAGLFRLDLGVRDRWTGGAYNVEWKTDSNPSDIHLRMEYYLQLLLEAKALSNHLGGEHVSGTIIIGVDKGSKTGPTAGDYKAGKAFGERRKSPFTYAYRRDKGNGPEYRRKYTANWELIPVWKNFGLQEWYDMLMSGAGIEDDPLDPFELFVETPPVRFNEERYQSIARQIDTFETDIALGASAVVVNTAAFGNGEEVQVILDRFFPQDFGQCKNFMGYRRQCSFFDLCHGAAALDPYSNGYVKREPNHALETTLKENQ